MAKQIKLNIKNKQLANALNLTKVKDKIAKKKSAPKMEVKAPTKKSEESKKVSEGLELVEQKPKIKARKKSAFQETSPEEKTQPVEVKVELSKEALDLPPPKVSEIKPKVVKPPPVEKLGPTGKHINDLLPPVRKEPPKTQKKPQKSSQDATAHSAQKKLTKAPITNKKFKEVKPTKRFVTPPSFDSRDRQGLRVGEEDFRRHRKRRNKGAKHAAEDTTIRPSKLKVRLPIPLKQLAAEMKFKASELISKLFMHGVPMTINDILEDETTVQLLGEELNCEITIDTSEQERIKITKASIQEEIQSFSPEELELRPPVIAFMGHVDHGKTTLIDKIRESNRASSEVGEITQHIGAFRTSTAVGDLAILDTPGHEAFSAMRARGADITDIVVLVIAGDEGIKEQTIEAIQHAKAANVSIVVAINKCDKPGFNQEEAYRQLSEQDLLPETWGGTTITVNCSGITGEGIKELLEMLALQAEVLELKANPNARARGTVIESEIHKGMGAVTTILVQNGTLRKGDALVFEQYWGKVKTIRDEHGKAVAEATPSTPVAITGLSGLPEAGQEFIVVSSEKEAKEISEARQIESQAITQKQTRRASLENLLAAASETQRKMLPVILRADVQGSLEALKSALERIESDKVDLNVIFKGVGEISESDVQLAAASNAIILGFHTQIESHASDVAKELGVQIHIHDIIYHAIDDVKALMAGTLDRLAQEEERGKAEVQATFKSSQHGIIAGCIVTEGNIHRNHHIRVRRDDEIIWKGKIASIRRAKDDVREVQKGIECGILFEGFKSAQEGDILEAYEVTYISQEL